MAKRRKSDPLPPGPSVEVIDVDEFCARFSPADGRTWAEAIASLVGDPADVEIIERLRADLRTGELRQPIRVDRAAGLVLDGMHRAVASFLDARSIPTTDELPDPEDMLEVFFELTRPHARPDGDEPGWDLEFAMSWLRSFPLDTDLWVTCDCFVGDRQSCSGIWYCPEERADALITALVDRAAIRGVRCTVHSWERVEPEDDTESAPGCS